MSFIEKKQDLNIPEQVQLIAVSKYVSATEIKDAYMQGHKVFGENKVQSLVEKAEILKDLNIEWHFIGHLQSNKVRKVLEISNYIHSIDSIKLLQRVNEITKQLNKETNVLLQVKLRPDKNKYGFNKEDILSNLNILEEVNSQNVNINGLMTILPIETIDNQELYRELKELRDEINSISKLNLKELSMGMSGDYEDAIKEGATMIRIGSALFK